MKLQPFTEMDWDAYAGAEGDAHIAVDDTMLVIVDARGLAVTFNDDTEDWYHFDTSSAKTVFNYLNWPLDREALLRIGFVKVN